MAATAGIIDADAHVNPSADMWVDYLPQKLREHAPRIESGEDCDYVVFEGRRRKVNLIAAQAGRKGKEFKMHGRVADARAGGWLPAARLDDMDQDGIDSAVLFGGGPLGTSNMELYRASFTAYNNWLADFCQHSPKRFIGVGYVSLEDVDESIAMMRSFVKRGLKAVCELGIPVTIHLGGRPVRFTNKKFLLSDLVMSKFGMAEPIAIMIYGGVFQRFPELKLVSVESGVGWFAFTANYMDETWKKQRYWVDSQLQHEPSYFWERNIYGSFIHDRPGIVTRHLRGAGNIMWSSDYPHSETTYPESQKAIEWLFDGVPKDEKDLICGGRAKVLYNV